MLAGEIYSRLLKGMWVNYGGLSGILRQFQDR